jgi:hypothetical protein
MSERGVWLHVEWPSEYAGGGYAGLFMVLLAEVRSLTVGIHRIPSCDSINEYHSSVNKSHRMMLAEVFSAPPPRNLEWQCIEALFLAVGAQRVEGRGSRVRFELSGEGLSGTRCQGVFDPSGC